MKNRKLIIGIAAMGMLLTCSVCIGLFGPKTAPEVTEQPPLVTSVVSPTNIPPAPTRPPKPLPTDTPRPLPTATPTLEALVADALGRSNRGIAERTSLIPGKEILVTWAINDNLTEGLVKSGAQMDVAKILKAVDASGVAYETIRLDGTFSMVDQYGNASEDTVILLTYGRGTIDRVNWDNFLWENVYIIADEAWVHPAFQK